MFIIVYTIFPNTTHISNVSIVRYVCSNIILSRWENVSPLVKLLSWIKTIPHLILHSVTWNWNSSQLLCLLSSMSCKTGFNQSFNQVSEHLSKRMHIPLTSLVSPYFPCSKLFQVGSYFPSCLKVCPIKEISMTEKKAQILWQPFARPMIRAWSYSYAYRETNITNFKTCFFSSKWKLREWPGVAFTEH